MYADSSGTGAVSGMHRKAGELVPQHAQSPQMNSLQWKQSSPNPTHAPQPMHSTILMASCSECPTRYSSRCCQTCSEKNRKRCERCEIARGIGHRSRYKRNTRLLGAVEHLGSLGRKRRHRIASPETLDGLKNSAACASYAMQ